MSADAPTTDDLARVLDAIDADTPPALEVAERLADATGVDVDTAQRVVWDAIDDGDLVEEGEGFGGVRLADDRNEPGGTGFFGREPRGRDRRNGRGTRPRRRFPLSAGVSRRCRKSRA